MQSCRIIYASTSGHTEHVVTHLAAEVQSARPAKPFGRAKCQVQSLRVELAKPEDLLKGDILILASGTWNTGGVEGQLNPHMHEFLLKRAKDVDLGGKPVAIIALGDDRYYYTARAGEHLRRFVQTHGGTILGDPLVIVNEPYGQEEKVRGWAQKLIVSSGVREIGRS